MRNRDEAAVARADALARQLDDERRKREAAEAARAERAEETAAPREWIPSSRRPLAWERLAVSARRSSCPNMGPWRIPRWAAARPYRLTGLMDALAQAPRSKKRERDGHSGLFVRLAFEAAAPPSRWLRRLDQTVLADLHRALGLREVAVTLR